MHHHLLNDRPRERFLLSWYKLYLSLKINQTGEIQMPFQISYPLDIANFNCIKQTPLRLQFPTFLCYLNMLFQNVTSSMISLNFSFFINIDLAGNYRIYKDLEKYFFFWCTVRDTRGRSIYTNTNYCDGVYASQKHHSVKKYPGRLLCNLIQSNKKYYA